MELSDRAKGKRPNRNDSASEPGNLAQEMETSLRELESEQKRFFKEDSKWRKSVRTFSALADEQKLIQIARSKPDSFIPPYQHFCNQIRIQLFQFVLIHQSTTTHLLQLQLNYPSPGYHSMISINSNFDFKLSPSMSQFPLSIKNQRPIKLS